MTFDPLTALTPVAKIADVPLVFFANPAVPARTLAEFIAYARANPGKLNYGTPSSGTVNHLLIERLKQATGIDLTHVPFRGSPQAAMALLANEIQLFPIGLSVARATCGKGSCGPWRWRRSKRLTQLPDVPTVSEIRLPGLHRGELVGHGGAQGYAGRGPRYAPGRGGRSPEGPRRDRAVRRDGIARARGDAGRVALSIKAERTCVAHHRARQDCP